MSALCNLLIFDFSDLKFQFNICQIVCPGDGIGGGGDDGGDYDKPGSQCMYIVYTSTLFRPRVCLFQATSLTNQSLAVSKDKTFLTTRVSLGFRSFEQVSK